jgi:tetratricopeptide (TPR) repeat protein
VTCRNKGGTVALDTSFVETRMAELGLKQYWLAEQLGVSPRTVLRWVNGQVRSIRREHVSALAQHLQCREDELSPPSTDIVDDAAGAAARAIAEDDLLVLLAPSSSYAMAETLIKASLDAAGTRHTLGKLLVMLSIAVGRQFRRDEAIEHAQRAACIGREIGNRVIAARAGYAEAWARLYAGEIAEAHRLFQSAVDELVYLGEPADAAMAWFGLGSCQGFEGAHELGLRSLDEAIAALEPLDRPVDLSMPLYVRGVMLLDVEQLDEAAASLERSRDLAARVGWKSGIGRATATLAEIAARRGAVADAVELYEHALAILANEGFIHPMVFLAGARTFRIAGDLPRARAEIERGLASAQRFRPERETLERLLAELAHQDRSTNAGR